MNQSHGITFIQKWTTRKGSDHTLTKISGES